MLPLTVKFKLLRRPPWCDQIPTPAENQLCPYSEHTCAHRHSHGSGKLFGESNHRKPGVVMSIIPLEFRGANSGGPPDLRGRRQNPRPKRASMKSRVNNSARPPSQKEDPPARTGALTAPRPESPKHKGRAHPDPRSVYNNGPGRDSRAGRRCLRALASCGRLNHGKPDPAIVPQGKRAKVYKVIR